MGSNPASPTMKPAEYFHHVAQAEERKRQEQRLRTMLVSATVLDVTLIQYRDRMWRLPITWHTSCSFRIHMNEPLFNRLVEDGTIGASEPFKVAQDDLAKLLDMLTLPSQVAV